MDKQTTSMQAIQAKKLAALIAANPGLDQQYLPALAGLGEAGKEYLRYYRAPRLARKLARTRPRANGPVELPEGARLLLYKHPLPGETQARLAYEYVLARFVRFLEQRDKAVAESESAGHVLLWFPLAPVPVEEVDDEVKERTWSEWLEKRWQDFLKELTSAQGLRQTFVLALNSAKLADGAGFSTLDVPIFNDSHALTIAGLYWLGMEKGLEVNRRDLKEAKDLLARASEEADAKKAEKLRDKAEEKMKKAQAFNEQARKGFKELIDLYKSQLPRTSKIIKAVLKQDDLQRLPELLEHHLQRHREVKEAARGYGPKAREQLNSARGDIFPKIVWEMVQLAEGEYQPYSLPPLLSVKSFSSGLRKAGDAQEGFCYSCGRALAEEEQGRKFRSRRLLFEAPEQRAQSAGSSGSVTVCAVCAGLSLLGPVKLTEETLVVRLGGRGDVQREAQRALEQQVLNELGASAGDYIALRATERDEKRDKKRERKKGDPAPKVWGRKEYAIAKLALTFPPEVFGRGLEVYLYDKGREIRLRPSTLYATASFARAYQQGILREEELNHRLGRAVRYFDQGKWILGEYELLRGFVEAGFPASERVVGREAEEARASLLEVIEMEGGQAEREVQKQQHIVGYASLLFAFTEEARRALDQKGLSQEEKDRELKKLLQLADAEPALFLNRVALARAMEGAGGYGYDEARLYWDERHQYGYRWAKELLEGVDREYGLNLRREEDKEIDGRPSRFLSLRPEDMCAVYLWLRTRYPSPADWRGFLYQAKLFLFTRYPRLLGG